MSSYGERITQRVRIENTRFGYETLYTYNETCVYRIIEIVTPQGHYITHDGLFSDKENVIKELSNLINKG